MHARGMNDMTTWQFARSRDRRLSNLHGSVSIALALNRRPATHADRARYSSTQYELVVGGVDDRIDSLLRQVAGSDHDSRRRHSSTSATRSPNSSGVALAIPFTPIDEMVIDAHATPHTSASCRPPRWPPVLNHRASIPPASASPAPVVSTTGRSVSAGTRTTPSSMYAARPCAPCLTTRPCSHHWRRNSSGSLPPSAANSSWLQKNQLALRKTSRASGGRA